MPAFLGELNELTALHLYEKGTTLPVIIGGCSRLTSLRLKENRLANTVPLPLVVFQCCETCCAPETISLVRLAPGRWNYEAFDSNSRIGGTILEAL